MYADTKRRMALRLATRKEQEARNAEHLLEQARAFAAMPECWKRLYERRQAEADQQVTDWIGGRQPKLEGLEES